MRCASSASRCEWDQLFGASSFAHKNIRRKADARAYPSRLEFGLRGGIVPPSALNNGEYVELLLGRITAAYFAIEDFDELPTPFRTVAVDLLSAQPIVMRNGSPAMPKQAPAARRDAAFLAPHCFLTAAAVLLPLRPGSGAAPTSMS